MRIKKVINNNILCVVDEKGHEMIVTGRGLGFKRKAGELLDESLVEKTYHMDDKAAQRRLRELAAQIEPELLELTENLVEYIQGQINQPLNESLLITMADHISFALRRKAEGLEFQNPLKGSVACYYPSEYRLGRHCLEEIREKTGVNLAEDEAAFLALHIVNAELNTNMSEMYDITRMIEGVIQVVEYYYGRPFDRDSLDFSRFVVHLRYFAQRIFQDKTMADGTDEQDILFRRLVARNSKVHYKCAQHIAEYIASAYHKTLSEEELIYLTIHLRRINLGGAPESPDSEI